MFNIIKDKYQLVHNIIKYYNIDKFRYNSYQAISIFKFISFVIVIDIWLGKVREIFISNI